MAGKNDYLAVDLCEVIIKHLEDKRMMNLADAKYRTIHHRGIDTVATETGITKSTLYRYALPTDQSGLDIPLEKLVPIMNSAKHYEILKIVAASCGFIPIKVPRAAYSKRDESEIVHHYQNVCSEAVAKLLKFFEKPSQKNCDAAVEALQTVAGESVAVKKRVQRHSQHEFKFE